MLFIDIGSGVGEEIEWATEHGYEVHAFEPNPGMSKILKKKFGLNPFVHLNFVAAWNKDSFMNLYNRADGDKTDLGVSLIKEKVNIDHEHYQEVKTINIGKYLKDLDEDIEVLKIDAEGAEYVILESILDNFDPKRIKKWLVEDHTHYIDSPEWVENKEKILERMKGIVIINWGDQIASFELLGWSDK